MKVTIDKIASDCGVSVATVSRVIANKSNVSDTTRSLIIKRMQELDYASDKVKQLISDNKKRSILFIAENINRTSNVFLFRAATEEFAQFNYVTTLCECKTQEERDAIIQYAKASYSGCVVISGSNGIASLQKYENDSFPLVAIHWCNDFGKVNSVVDDLRRASYLAVKYFVNKGHRRIAIICPEKKASGCREMVEGFKEGFERYDLPYDDSLIFYSNLSSCDGGSIACRIKEEMQDVTGVICANQDLVNGAIVYLSHLKLCVPEALSFIALSVHGLFNNYITSIGSPADKVGSLAARMLYDSINGNSSLELPTSAKILLDPTVMEGHTVKNLAQG